VVESYASKLDPSWRCTPPAVASYRTHVAERASVQNTAVPWDRLLSVRHNPDEVARRRARVDDWPVTNLNAWVRDEVRPSPLLPEAAGRTVPWFDPDGGGEEAQLLFLMQDPSEVATGTGFVSPDNDDLSARNSTVACREAGLTPRARVHWNIYPHWVNVAGVDRTRPPQTYGGARRSAVRFLGELLAQRLPKVRVIVLLGRHAQRGWDDYLAGGGILPSGVPEPLRCPSCSPQAWNNRDKRTGVPNKQLIVDTLQEAATYLDG
jgi:uracil-DNA glycosylase